MVDSVNTNAGSSFGVQNLSSNNSLLNKTQTELSTGKSVSSAKDDAATFAIAQKLLSNLGGRNAVADSLNRAISAVDVSLSATGVVSDLLVSLKEKAVQAADPGLDANSRLALNDEFQALKEQITTTINSAGFNETNPLVSGGGDISALTDETGNETITIDENDLSLGGSTVTLQSGSTLLTEADAASAVAEIEDSITNVNDFLSTLGSGASRLSDTSAFNSLVADSTEAAVGDLTDANLSVTAADLASREVKQALGIASLNIANQAPQALLSLFR